jgi:hypothetical protein
MWKIIYFTLVLAVLIPQYSALDYLKCNSGMEMKDCGSRSNETLCLGDGFCVWLYNCSITPNGLTPQCVPGDSNGPCWLKSNPLNEYPCDGLLFWCWVLNSDHSSIRFCGLYDPSIPTYIKVLVGVGCAIGLAILILIIVCVCKCVRKNKRQQSFDVVS